ncbi:MAG: hypothetical protein D3923_07755 [Candidatus Electrothrix sp. AR3]|nr:hypothetical protein [Candidatus Electrothrix sp. AR3]
MLTLIGWTAPLFLSLAAQQRPLCFRAKLMQNMEFKSQPTSNLVAMAYETYNEDDYWKLITELHKRGSSCEFNIAKDLVNSNDAVKREIGADILGQLGWSKKNPFHTESVSLLIELLSDKNGEVVASAGFSLGHKNDTRAVPRLLKLVGHSNPKVRYGVVSALSGLENDRAIEALIKLSHDNDFDVRNWATFGLGSQCDIDTPALRAALFERVSDKEYEIRGEALVGLAQRNDLRIKSAILKELEGEFEGSWVLEAAQLLALPEFCEPLIRLKNQMVGKNEYFLREANEAINACCAKET